MRDSFGLMCDSFAILIAHVAEQDTFKLGQCIDEQKKKADFKQSEV